MLIIDGQIHLFRPDEGPHLARIGQVMLTEADVLAAMDRAGVERAYLVPGGSRGNQACVAATGRYPGRFQTMGIVPLGRPEGRHLLASWQSSGMRGARVGFAPYRKPSWLRDGTADWFWPAAEAAQIPVMVWAPEQLDEIARIAAQHPGLKLIVDHFGLFVDDRDEKVGEVVEKLCPLARFTNLAVKASALPCHTLEPYPFRKLHPFIRQVVDSFGPTRVFWGSDLTRLTCSYEQAITLFTDALDFLTQDDLSQIMGNGILNWVGWAESSPRAAS
jgi:L-fuconolactonase